MEYHGWELVLYLLSKLLIASIWPVTVVAVVWMFQKEVREGIARIAAKISELTEARLGGARALFGGTVGWKGGPLVKSKGDILPRNSSRDGQ